MHYPPSELLVDPALSFGLPAFLAAEPGLNSGLMIAEVTSAALMSENKQLAHPASVDSTPTSANQEDHVSMACHGARRLGQMVGNLEAILGIEALAAVQGIEFRAPLTTSPKLQQVMAAVRGRVPALARDRFLAPDLAAATDLVASDIKSDSAKLTWKAATDNVAVTSYEIYNLGQFVKSVPATPTSTVMTGLKPNVTYGFYVNAKDAAGNISQASNTAEFKTPPAQDDPIPPTAPKNLRSPAQTANSITLNWDASTDNVGVTRYEVYSGGAKVGDSTTTSATIGGLKANTEYKFTVKAFDAVGNASPASNELTARTRSGGDQVGAVTQIATDNDVPWGLAFLPGGDGIYSRRDAQDIVRITPSGTKTTLGKVPGVSGTNGEGGLLGIELSPTFAADGLIYVYHTASGDNRIVRAKIEGNSLTGWTTLLTGIPRNKFHNGGRLRFGVDGKLYAGTGDGQNGANAQNKQNLGGKVLRLNPDGSAPSDNPFFSEGGNARYVWTYGHRNVQGLAVDSQGRMWQAELGNSNMDEINLLQKGGNFGWPSCEGTSGSCGGYVAPKKTFSVGSASPSGLAIVNDVLFLAALRGERLYRMQINGSSVGTTTSHFQGTYGRLRTPEPAPDGSLWVTTSNGDKDSTAGNSNTKLLKVALN